MNTTFNHAARKTYVNSGNIKLAVYEWGDNSKPTILCVHGYPDNHQVWNPVIERLHTQYHCVSYDVRGFGDSAVPKRIREWSLAHLSKDLQAVMNAVSPDQPVHLVAHDWGSIQTWESVTEPALQSRIASYTSVSGPCLDHVGMLFREQIKHGGVAGISKVLTQVAHSWYIALFQLPLLGPGAWQLGLDKQWPRILKKIEGVEESGPNLTQRKDGKYGVNLYRANFIRALLSPRERHTTVPVQLIVPTGDHYVTTNLFERLDKWAPKLWRRDIDAKHWLPLSHSDELATAIKEFESFVRDGDSTFNQYKVGSN